MARSLGLLDLRFKTQGCDFERLELRDFVFRGVYGLGRPNYHASCQYRADGEV